MTLYNFSKASADVGVLQLELSAAAIPVSVVTGPLAGSVSVTTSRDLTAGEQVTATAVVAAHPDAAFATKRLNDAAISMLTTSPAIPSDVQSAAMLARATMRMLASLLNEIRPPINRPAVTEASILASMLSNMASGIGLVSSAIPAGTLGALQPRYEGVRVATPAVLLGGSSDVTVTWSAPFANTNYTVVVTLEGTGVLGLTPIVKSRALANCVVTLKNALLVNILAGAGTLHVITISNNA